MRLIACASTALVWLGAMISLAVAEIEIAVVGPMSGDYAVFGEQMKRGAEQAVSDINTGGGLFGDRLTLFVKDDGCDPIRAVAIANQLPAFNVKFVAGHLCSETSIQAARIYAEEGIIQITPASTDPSLTERGSRNVFRLSGREDQQGTLAGQLLARYFPKRKIAILHNNSTNGKRIAEAVKRSLNAARVTETLFEAYEPAQQDYRKLVEHLKAQGIEVFYVGGHHAEAAVMVKQARDIGYRPQLVSGDTLTAEEFWQISEGAGEGALMTATPDPRFHPDAAAVVARLRAQQFEPSGYTLSTYAAIQIWVQAAKLADTTVPEKVIEAMRSRTFKTVLGEIAFDSKGDVSTPRYAWYRWSKGSYARLR